MQNNTMNCDGLVLFSGGLDSVLAARVLQEQGLDIICLHFVSPFFGTPARIPYWSKTYGIKIQAVDISDDYVRMLRKPVHGWGSVLNPCVDCKILMISKARELMHEYGAKFLASGEVLGQRPMSQRRDTLNIIRRDAGVKEVLLRPLSAKLLDPTEAELSGLVDREKLYSLSGRGRKGQMDLAAKLGIKDIPTPGGGCLLTEKENARSFWPILRYGMPDDGSAGALEHPADDFRLARTGRQLWHFADGRAYWLCIGRNNADNESLHKHAAEGDLTLKVKDFPGPIALLRSLPRTEPCGAIPDEIVQGAASFMASFSGKAVRFAEENSQPVPVRVHEGPKGLDGPGRMVSVMPARRGGLGWAEFVWEQAREEIREIRLASGIGTGQSQE